MKRESTVPFGRAMYPSTLIPRPSTTLRMGRVYNLIGAGMARMELRIWKELVQERWYKIAKSRV